MNSGKYKNFCKFVNSQTKWLFTCIRITMSNSKAQIQYEFCVALWCYIMLLSIFEENYRKHLSVLSSREKKRQNHKEEEKSQQPSRRKRSYERLESKSIRQGFQPASVHLLTLRGISLSSKLWRQNSKTNINIIKAITFVLLCWLCSSSFRPTPN